MTETAKLLLDAGEDVPCELMAFVLKFQMLQVKASDEHRRAGRQVRQTKRTYLPCTRSCWWGLRGPWVGLESHHYTCPNIC